MKKKQEKERFNFAREELEKKIVKLLGKEKEMIEAVELAKASTIVEFKASK